MDMEIREKRKHVFGGRGRAFSLVEVLIAIIIISVALVAMLNVFSSSLMLTVDASRNSKELMASYAQVQQSFFLPDLNPSPLGVQVSAAGNVTLKFRAPGTGTVTLKRYDVGTGRTLRTYRP